MRELWLIITNTPELIAPIVIILIVCLVLIFARGKNA